MQITGDLNDEYLIMSMISRHVVFMECNTVMHVVRILSLNPMHLRHGSRWSNWTNRNCQPQGNQYPFPIYASSSGLRTSSLQFNVLAAYLLLKVHLLKKRPSKIRAVLPYSVI